MTTVGTPAEMVAQLRTQPWFAGLEAVAPTLAYEAAIMDGTQTGRPLSRSLTEHVTQPTLVIGHPSDPIHPFSDADRTARELPNARLVTASSMLEWRLHPDRLDRELLGFLDEVWQPHRAVA